MKSNYSLAFAITAALVTTFAGAVSSLAMDLGWTGEPMSASGDSIRTNGALVYAYCGGVNGTTTTVNGVAFTVFNRPGTLPSGLTPLFNTSPQISMDFADDSGPAGVTDPEYVNLLRKGWWQNQKGDFTFTLNGLEANHAYLVQLIIYRSNTGYTVTAPDGETFVKSSGTDWAYGGTLIGVIMTTSTSHQFVINSENTDSRTVLNAIQVRDLGIAPTVIEPMIGSLSAKPVGPVATLSLAGIVMGTGDDTEPATSYSVSYKLGDADPVTALENQTNTTASFTIEDLSDGDYTCEVTITTDKGKTSAAKTVSFTVNSTLGDFGALKAALEGAAPGATITVGKGFYLATSTINVTAANVTLVSSEGKTKTIIDGNAAYRILSVSGGNFTVEGITFKNGCAGATGRGGAINYSSASVAQTTQIKNCDFVDCTAQYGGAIYSGDGSYTSFEPRENYGIVTGCTFLRCGIVTSEYQGGGGAISGALWIEDSIFDACYVSPSDGGRYHAAIDVSSYMTVTNCIFRNHSQTHRGLVGSKEQRELLGRALLVDCLIANNSGSRSDDVLFHRKVILDRCVISNNTTTVTTALAGLFRTDYAGDMEFSKFTSCLFIDNQYPFSLNQNKMPALINCTFVRNVGGLAVDYGLTTKPAITNCVFWGNIAKTSWPHGATYKGVPGLYYHGAVSFADLINIGNTIIENGSANSDVASVLAADSTGNSTTLTATADSSGIGFADAANGDWRPGRASVLRDAGVKADWMVGALDLAGNPRLLDAEGLPRLNALPDIGCYEFKNNRAALTIVIR